tara:strand:+ start:38 stop:826 length:789 start_codon:yes stop_codon:yes gene_type:complete
MATRKKTTTPRKPVLEQLFPQRKRPPRRPEEKFAYLLKETPLVKLAAAIILYQGGKGLYNFLSDKFRGQEPRLTKLTTIVPKNIPISIPLYFNSRVGEWREPTVWDFEDNLKFYSKSTGKILEVNGQVLPTGSSLMTPNKISEFLFNVFESDVWIDQASNEQICKLMNIFYAIIYSFSTAQNRAIFNSFLLDTGENLAKYLKDQLYFTSDWTVTPFEVTIGAVYARLASDGALLPPKDRNKANFNILKPVAVIAFGIYLFRN